MALLKGKQIALNTSTTLVGAANDDIASSLALKTYIDNAVLGLLDYKGAWDASSGAFPGGAGAKVGDFYKVTVAGTVDGVVFTIGDQIIAEVDAASTTTYAGNWTYIDNTEIAAVGTDLSYTAATREIASSTGNNVVLPVATTSDAGLMTAAQFDKLAFVTVTQAVDLDAMEQDIADHQAALGIADGAQDMGTYIGNTITDNQTVKQNLQELETALEAVSTHVEEDIALAVTAISTNQNVTIGGSPTGGIAGIASVAINGHALSASEVVSVTASVLVINVPYATDATDVLTIRYV